MLKVSNYHYIRNNFKTQFPSIFGVTPSNFKKQLILLKNEGDGITPKDFQINYNEIIKSKDSFFFITFDDGLKEQYELALPILEDLGLQAIFFANSINLEMKKVSTVHKIHLLRSILSPKILLNYLEKQEIKKLNNEELKIAQFNYRYDDEVSAELKYLLNFKIPFEIQESIIHSIFKIYFSEKEVFDFLYMNKKQLKDLAEIACLGSHTHSHYPLGLLSEEKIHYELAHSKQYFEKLTSKIITMVAYPYGTDETCTDLVANTAKKVGYLYGFTTKRGIVDKTQKKLLLNRFDCNDLVGGKNYNL